MNENLKAMVPKNLDAQPKIFIWDFDVAMIFLSMTALGILLGALIAAMILGVILCKLYQKVKSGRQHGYSIHLLYWISPVNIGNRRTPPSCARSFIG